MAPSLCSDGNRHSGLVMFNAELDKDKTDLFFYKAIAVVFFIRLVISAWLPITGDEAYFVVWGHNLDYGYYDHTPFVGWLLTVLLTISDATWWLRLPSVLLPLFISLVIYHLLKTRQSEVALWVALSFLVAPVNIINVLITNDTSLIFFSFVSGWYFYQALTNDSDKHSYYHFILCGLFLGLAFISKYFAVFLGFTYGLYIIFFHHDRKSLTGLLLIFLMVLPFVFINIFWNYNNCWSNILFNLYNRATNESDSLINLSKYIAVLIYLLSPVMIYYIFKNIRQFKVVNQVKHNHVYLWLTVIPLILFLLLTVRKLIGLHWLLSFYPFAFIALAPLLKINQWRNTFYFMLLLSVIHLAGLIMLLMFPVSIFTSNVTAQQNAAFGKNPHHFLDQLKKYEKKYIFSTISYGVASIASHYSNKDFIVFGEGSVHGRADDKITDFKNLNGKNILILKRSKSSLEYYKVFFEKTERKTIEKNNIRYELLLGQGFKYEVYRENILKKVNQDYYNIPDWLPVGACGFKEKYNLD